MLERVIRETCIAGAVIDRCIKASFPHKGKRKRKEKATPDAVKRIMICSQQKCSQDC